MKINKVYRILLLIVTSAVILFILFIEFITENKFDLSLSEKLSNIILFITAAAIVWYSVETYYLKLVQQKSLKQQRIRDDFEILPFLDISFFKTESECFVKNTGRGIAQNIKLKFRYKYKETKKEFTKSINYIASGETEQFDEATDYQLFDELGSLLSSGSDVKIDGNFQDIAGRIYYCRFQSNPNTSGNFDVIKQGPSNWKIG